MRPSGRDGLSLALVARSYFLSLDAFGEIMNEAALRPPSMLGTSPSPPAGLHYDSGLETYLWKVGPFPSLPLFGWDG